MATQRLDTDSVDSLEKKAKVLNEPEYSDTIFEDTLTELKAKEVAFRETLKQARRLVVDFKASMSQKMVDALVEDGVDLRVPFSCVKPEDAPIRDRLTAEYVGHVVLDKLQRLIPHSDTSWDLHAFRRRDSLFLFLQAVCIPGCRTNSGLPPIDVAIAKARQCGLVKLADYLPRLLRASTEFFSKPLCTSPSIQLGFGRLLH